MKPTSISCDADWFRFTLEDNRIVSIRKYSVIIYEIHELEEKCVLLISCDGSEYQYELAGIPLLYRSYLDWMFTPTAHINLTLANVP